MSNDQTSKLHAFFLHEINSEAASGFARISRVPDSNVRTRLEYFRSLKCEEQQGFLDCCAAMACFSHGAEVGIPKVEWREHPCHSLWSYQDFSGSRFLQTAWFARALGKDLETVKARGVYREEYREQIERAISLTFVKAPELRKCIKRALAATGSYEIFAVGGGSYEYLCRDGENEFTVHIDYGGRTSQLRYHVSIRDGVAQKHRFWLCFEDAMGFGRGEWDHVTEDNLDDVMLLLAEAVRYLSALPDRMREAIGA